jgi:hypothetical protein
MKRLLPLTVLSLWSICIARGDDAATLKSEEVYAGWVQMYDLQFANAHETFAGWQNLHRNDSLGFASDAAAYLFSELARLQALEAELFVQDERFLNRKKLVPDPEVKARFVKKIDEADKLATADLQQSATHERALFVKSLTYGLRANYAALIDRQGFRALSYTKQGRPYAEKLIATNPEAFDAYLGPGIENYLLSLQSAPVRVFLRLTGSSVDREKGLTELRQAAAGGYYFEPFAKLLLVVAALRDNDKGKARDLLRELRQRFPDNPLYGRQLERLDSGSG